MFKQYSIAYGAICIGATIAMGLNELSGLALILIGLFIACLLGFVRQFMHEDEEVLKAPVFVIGLMVVTAGIGIMPMDGDWFLFWATTAFSLVFAWFTAACIYDLRANLFDAASLRDINRIAIAIGLPVLGLSLVRYLVETDRSVVSGVILMIGLACAGYRLAPRTVIRRTRSYVTGTA